MFTKIKKYSNIIYCRHLFFDEIHFKDGGSKMAETQVKKFKKVLVANRGEIAIRIYRALNELGIQTVGVFSKEDRYSLFRTKTDESYILDIKKGPVDAYLDIATIIKIAKSKNVVNINAFICLEPRRTPSLITFIAPAK